MPLLDFLSGAITLGFAVVSLFFFRFWKRTDDALFASFGAAFLLLALNRALLSLAATPIAEPPAAMLPNATSVAVATTVSAHTTRPCAAERNSSSFGVSGAGPMRRPARWPPAAKPNA